MVKYIIIRDFAIWVVKYNILVRFYNICPSLFYFRIAYSLNARTDFVG